MALTKIWRRRNASGLSNSKTALSVSSPPAKNGSAREARRIVDPARHRQSEPQGEMFGDRRQIGVADRIDPGRRVAGWRPPWSRRLRRRTRQETPSAEDRLAEPTCRVKISSTPYCVLGDRVDILVAARPGRVKMSRTAVYRDFDDLIRRSGL
jgi:hypothetical protein